MVVVVVVVAGALWSAGGVDPAGAADCEEAALLELASGAVPGALVAGWLLEPGCELALDWSLWGIELAEEELDGCELEADVSLLGVVLDEFGELEAAAGALPILSLDDEEAAPELLLAPLSHLSETMFTLSTLNLL